MSILTPVEEGVMPDRPNWAPGYCAWCSEKAEYRAVSRDGKWVWPSCGVHSFENNGGE